MTTLAPLLPALAHDLSDGDAALVDRVRATLSNPPTTTGEVGFYGAESFPPAMNCFLWTVAELERGGHLLAAEDKYILELVDAFAAHVELPAAMRSWFPEELAWDGDFAALGLDAEAHGRAEERFVASYHRAVSELEAAFEAKGKTLRMLQFHIGDTLPFVVVTPAVAAKWDGVAVAEDGQGRPLGLTPLDRRRFFDHLRYAARWGVSYPPT